MNVESSMKDKYYEAYFRNQEVNEYVSKYCVRHDKSLLEAIRDVIVRNYIDYKEG